MLRRTVLALLTLICVGLLAGCTPNQRGYVVAHDGQFTLKIVATCQNLAMTRVGVKYLEPDLGFDDFHTVWQAKTADGNPVTAVTLFKDSTGLTVETADSSIDLNREMVIWWDEGNDITGSIIGTLGSLSADSVLWDEGVETEEEFLTREPTRLFGC